MSGVYYNEYDAKKAAWLRELMRKNIIAQGVVDERSILDVRADELTGYTQVHLCSGIGIWSYALRLAGWPDDRPVWTGSEPCQPHSSAGKMLGDDDERYLRWAIHHHIEHAKRPDIPYYFEQVANGDGLSWLDTLCADMEGAAHTVRAYDLCSAGFGAPHMRQRIFGMAHSNHAEYYRDMGGAGSKQGSGSSDGCITGRLADMLGEGLEGFGEYDARGGESRWFDARSNRSAGPESAASAANRSSGPTNGFWRDADWLRCRDGKWRPVGSGTFPLAHGAAERVLRLRGYGDGINAQQAAWFIQATKDVAWPWK